MSNKNDHDIYIIPPNFIETGTFFGGMFRARTVIEAGNRHDVVLAKGLGIIQLSTCCPITSVTICSTPIVSAKMETPAEALLTSPLRSGGHA